MEFLLNNFPCCLLKGEHSTLFQILSFYVSFHFKSSFQTPYVQSEMHLLSKCLGEHNSTPWSSFASPWTLWEKGQEYQFKARSQSVSPSVTFRTVVALQELPCPATLNTQEQICIPPVNRKAIVCTIESHDLMTIHEKLLNSLVWGILHRALHGANRI